MPIITKLNHIFLGKFESRKEIMIAEYEEKIKQISEHLIWFSYLSKQSAVCDFFSQLITGTVPAPFICCCLILRMRLLRKDWDERAKWRNPQAGNGHRDICICPAKHVDIDKLIINNEQLVKWNQLLSEIRLSLVRTWISSPAEKWWNHRDWTIQLERSVTWVEEIQVSLS